MAKNMFSCQSFDPVHSASFLRSSSTARTCSCRDEIHQPTGWNHWINTGQLLCHVHHVHVCNMPDLAIYCTMVAALSHIHWWHLWNPMNSCWTFHMNTRLDHGLRAYKHVSAPQLLRRLANVLQSLPDIFLWFHPARGGDGEMHLTTTLLWCRDGYKQVHCSLFNEVSGKNCKT